MDEPTKLTLNNRTKLGRKAVGHITFKKKMKQYT